MGREKWSSGARRRAQLDGLGFLADLAGSRPGLQVVLREVDRDPAARDALVAISEAVGAWPPGVPTFVYGGRVLVGFDFDFGFPAGTAARLNLDGRPWEAMGKFLAANIVDKADNSNNRYQVAAKMNRLMTDQPWPFWGAPASQAQRWLTTTKPPEGAGADIPEFRATELAARKDKLPPKSVWQMHGAGAIGGLTLVGVPMLRRLLDKLGASAAVWPFNTGWRELTEADVAPLSAVVVEVWPALFDAKRQVSAEGVKEYKTQAQVRAAAEAFARMDDAGDLQKAFAPPASADEALIAQVEGEEGWILGV